MVNKVIVITGATCSGKTSLSLLLAEELKSEIISADSRQIFKMLNIGTAKPKHDEQIKIKHHFIDILNPDEYYNANLFEIDSLEIIKNLHKKGIIPIVVGGSTLYIKALIDGLTAYTEPNVDIRKELIKKREIYGNEYLHDELKKYDPVSAETLLPQNWKRVLRALEVVLDTGKPLWQHHSDYKRETDVEFIQFALDWERKKLYNNINKRVNQMIEDGLVEEVKSVLSAGYREDINALNTVGYKEIIEYLNDKMDLEKSIELIKRNTRHYAKRQLTWFRRDERITWLSINSSDELIILKDKIISSLKK